MSSHRLYVGNIDTNVSELALIKLLSVYGKISKLDYLYHKDGPSKGRFRGFCFVEYQDPLDAQKAIKHLDGKEIKGRTMRVSYSIVNEDEEQNQVRKQCFNPKENGNASSRKAKMSMTAKIGILERKLSDLERQKKDKERIRAKPYDRSKSTS